MVQKQFKSAVGHVKRYSDHLICEMIEAFLSKQRCKPVYSSETYQTPYKAPRGVVCTQRIVRKEHHARESLPIIRHFYRDTQAK